jgi:hypothetical protein
LQPFPYLYLTKDQDVEAMLLGEDGRTLEIASQT